MHYYIESSEYTLVTISRVFFTKDGGEDSCFITSLSSKYEVKNIIVKINKRVYCFIINIIKVNTEYVKSQKCHVYKRTGKVYNNPHPGSGVV